MHEIFQFSWLSSWQFLGECKSESRLKVGVRGCLACPQFLKQSNMHQGSTWLSISDQALVKLRIHQDKAPVRPSLHNARPPLIKQLFGYLHLFFVSYTKSLVNMNSFYTNFTNTHFQKVPIPHLTRTMKQKFLH